MKQVDSKRYELNMERRAARMARAEARRREARRQAIVAGLTSLLLALGVVATTIVGFLLGWYNAATTIGPDFDISRDWPVCVVVGTIVAVALNALLIYFALTDDSEDNSR